MLLSSYCHCNLCDPTPPSADDNHYPDQESSISEEVEAELRPASRGSSHTPLLPSKKVHIDRILMLMVMMMMMMMMTMTMMIMMIDYHYMTGPTPSR